MDVQLKFRSIAQQWSVNILLIIVVAIVVIEAVMCSLIKSVNLDRVRARANEYAQEFSVLSMVPTESFYSTAREYAEKYEHKDKVEIEIIDAYGNAFISTSGFSPEETEMPDYIAAKSSPSGSSHVQTKTSYGEPILCGTNMLADYGSGSNGAVRWIVSLENVNRSIGFARAMTVLIGVIIIAVTAVSGIYFIKSIVKPIRDVSSAARRIAMGDFNTSINIKKNNEIGELCDSINYMASELRQAENMKNDFISSVSHELRTPLTAIRGWGETSKMSVGTDEQIVKKGLDVVLSETERLSQLVEELLDFSRIQNGKLTVIMEPLKISPILKEIVDMYNELALQHKISLEFFNPKKDSTIKGDKNRLKQVFINVIDNAVKYTESGGQVIVEQSESEGCVRITVKDTGVGIPAQDIDRVKEKFFKSNKTVRGSGIGLAVADEIVKQHKGLLFLESTEGIGTTVTVAFPLFESEEDQPVAIEIAGDRSKEEEKNIEK